MNTVVSVLRGGPSNEHDISLRSGHTILSNLSGQEFTVRDIYIDRSGVWHERGRATTPSQVLPTTDVAFIALHGAYGQDGEVQKILDQYGVPYTGANSMNSFVASHKVIAKEHAKRAGILTPRFKFVENADSASGIVIDAVRTFAQPMVIKPVNEGSSRGVSIVGGFKAVLEAVIKILAVSGSKGVLIEERIKGREATVGVIDLFRNEEHYVLPVVEIIAPTSAEFFSYDAKYSGESQEICPGRFSKEEKEQLSHAARTMHKELNQRHYSRSDFMISPKGIYFLELNTAAAVGMTTESLFPKSLASVGVTLPDFLSHTVGLALGR
jgi:D-alanine-D-alanine ligase